VDFLTEEHFNNTYYTPNLHTLLLHI